MSQENVEIVRRIYDVWAERRLPAWELFASDAEFDASDVMPDVGVIRGREAAEPAWFSYANTFEKFQIQLLEIIHTGPNHVVTAVRDGGRVKGSEAEIWNQFFHTWTIRDGKVIRWSSHLDRNRALEAAGLSE